LSDFASGWILPGGMSVKDRADQDLLLSFFKEDPAFREAALEAVRRAGWISAMPTQIMPIATSAIGTELRTGTPPPPPSPGAIALGTSALPRNPTRIAEARAWFETRNQQRNVTQRTADEQLAAIDRLDEFFATTELGRNPWVHEIDTHHMVAYAQYLATRTGRHKNNKGEKKLLSSNTIEKRLSELTVFFSLMTDELKASLTDPMSGLATLRKDLSARGDAEILSYWPYTDEHIKRIFDPATYLAGNRDPDYFWAPLVAAHLGVRLGEIVVRAVDDVRQDGDGIWFISIPFGKTKNSKRLLPLTDPLIELGFVSYVKSIRQIGGHRLFPHRDFTSPTALKNPTKNQTQKFGEYMDAIGLSNPRLTFHSFRHTVVNALLDNGTAVHLSMQICGHEAQEEAIKRKLITEKEASSVHMGTYAQPDLPRLGNANPLRGMKDALEQSVRLPIDYARLRVAARIVQSHVRKVGGRFETGWAAQNPKYTEEMLSQLTEVSSSVK
jgi:integrase